MTANINSRYWPPQLPCVLYSWTHARWNDKNRGLTVSRIKCNTLRELSRELKNALPSRAREIIRWFVNSARHPRVYEQETAITTGKAESGKKYDSIYPFNNEATRKFALKPHIWEKRRLWSMLLWHARDHLQLFSLIRAASFVGEISGRSGASTRGLIKG